MFPLTLDEVIPSDHLGRVLEAFVNRLAMAQRGFVGSDPAATGRPGYAPRDLLKLYVYGYRNQMRSSRRLEAECQRNVEVMWLLGTTAARLQVDRGVPAVAPRSGEAGLCRVGAVGAGGGTGAGGGVGD